MRRLDFNLFALAALLIAAAAALLLFISAIDLRVGLGLVAVALACWFASGVAPRVT